MIYPKIITVENPKLKTLMQKKGELITLGRAKSEEIELLEKQMEETDKKIQEEEKKVNIEDLLEKEKVETKIVEECIEKMKVIKQEIFDRMIKEVPAELHTKYDELKKKKEELEIERNKLALKAQKYSDKIIPIGKAMMKPFLTDMYEDYESLSLEGEEVVATIFSHMNDFKINFKKKQ